MIERPGELDEVDAVAATLEGQLDAAVGETFPIEAVGQVELTQQLDRRVLEHAGPHAVLDVRPGRAASSTTQSMPRAFEQVGQHEAGRPGPDDADLRLVRDVCLSS